MSVTMYVCITYTHRSNHQVSHNKPISRIIALLVVKPIRNWTSTFEDTLPAFQRISDGKLMQENRANLICMYVRKQTKIFQDETCTFQAKTSTSRIKLYSRSPLQQLNAVKQKLKVIVNDRARNEPRSPRRTSPCAPYPRHKFSDRNGTARHQISFPIL